MLGTQIDESSTGEVEEGARVCEVLIPDSTGPIQGGRNRNEKAE